METEKGDNTQARPSRENRRHLRYPVDGDSAALLFVDLGLTRECKIVDLSLEGCRLRCGERLPRGAGARVEAAFRINGIGFRFIGVVRWIKGQQAGIQFIEMIPRRRVDLTELIEEFEAAAQKKPAENEKVRDAVPASRADRAVQALPNPGAPPLRQPARAAPASAETAIPKIAAVPKTPADSQTPTAPQGAKAERRAQARHRVDTSATIIFVRAGSSLTGRIADLSLGGCRIQTHVKFPLGIYTRVEVEFRLDGLPFRLGGVIQGVHNRDIVGVRFLDLSDRKRQQITELIEEIERGQPASSEPGSPDASLQAQGRGV